MSLKVEVEAGKTVPVLTWGQESLWWKVLKGGPHVRWPSPNSAGPPLGDLEVEVGPAQLEVAEEVTEVTVETTPFLTSALKTQMIFMSLLWPAPSSSSSQTRY